MTLRNYTKVLTKAKYFTSALIGFDTCTHQGKFENTQMWYREKSRQQQWDSQPQEKKTTIFAIFENPAKSDFP